MNRKTALSLALIAFILGLGGFSYWMIVRVGQQAIDQQETLPNYLRTEAHKFLDGQGRIWLEDFDSNGDGQPEILAYTPVAGAADTSGGAVAFERLALLQLGRRKGRPLLTVDRTGVRDSLNRPLVDQISAPHGYRAEISKVEGRLRLHLTLLDAQGQRASDELTFAYDDSKKSYALVSP